MADLRNPGPTLSVGCQRERASSNGSNIKATPVCGQGKSVLRSAIPAYPRGAPRSGTPSNGTPYPKRQVGASGTLTGSPWSPVRPVRLFSVSDCAHERSAKLIGEAPGCVQVIVFAGSKFWLANVSARTSAMEEASFHSRPFGVSQ
jgi:hypothetical protein